jgi:hypothetical protein
MDQITFEQLSKEVVLLQRKVEYIEMLLDNISSDRKVFSCSIKDKCCSSYNKSDLAQLFYVLMNENILFFDKQNESNNRSKMQEFIMDSFTYFGDTGTQTPIRTISKQFSEVKGFTYRDKHLKFLDKILMVLQERKQKMARR